MTVVDIIIILLIGINTATINNLFINYILFMALGVSFGIYIGTLNILLRISEEREDVAKQIIEELEEEDKNRRYKWNKTWQVNNSMVY